MTAVITKMAITSALGEDENEIHQRVMAFESGISKIDYFNTEQFMANIAGNLNHKTWDKVRKIAKDENIDNSSALTIYTIQKLVNNANLHLNTVGIALGTCNGGIESLSKYYDETDSGKDGINNLRNYPLYKQINDVSSYFNFGGPRFSFNSACAASSAAIAYATQMINEGKATEIIAGGSDPMSQWVFAGFNALKTFNKENATPYGEKYGLNLGEAATFFIIKDKNKAIEDGDDIICEILGYGFTNDAHHPTAPDSEGNGIALAIQEAINASNLTPADINYINSHGTGTAANDVAEFKGIQQVFGKNLPWISSLKGYMGHNLGAAASTELALSLIGLKNNILYGNYSFADYRNETRNNKILRNHIDLSGFNKNEFNFINNNAAFGGHNSAIAFRFNLDGHYNLDAPETNQSEGNVYINEISEATIYELKTSRFNSDLNREKPLKEFKPELYRRRMNELSQISIIAATAMENLAVDPKRNGLVFGTALGSMNATTTYIESIRSRGFGNASGIYFPDLVVNSTAGSISRALNLKGYSASISAGGTEDLKSIEIAFEAMKQGRADVLIAGAGIESNPLTEQLLNHKVNSKAVMVEMGSEYLPNKTLAKIKKVASYQIKSEKELLKHVDDVSEGTLLTVIAPINLKQALKNKNISFVEQDSSGIQGIETICQQINNNWHQLTIFEISNDGEATLLTIEKTED